MSVIHQLSPGVVNKIAAGEVIERPASVVKELMENSVDAGARRIEVTVAQGGLELIRVADDGSGISPEQLPLAVASHATSKIQDADDLFRVQTLGFRGEALASIAAVSRLVLRSRTTAEAGGAELEVAGGQSRDVAPCGCPVGTTIEVHNLFFNTPVRRKFLRSTQTEMGYVAEAFTRIALAHPRIHCTLRHQLRVVHELPPASDWRTRIEAFFGTEVSEALIAVSSDEAGVSVSGYVANPSHSRANPRMQYLFLNGRAIRDRALQHALGEAYRGLLLTGRYPIAFLRIEMPPELVDVNVHPTKLEVRFQESGRLYSQLLGTLRGKFLTTDLTARLQPVAPNEAAAAHDAGRADQLRRNLVDWAKGQLQTVATSSAAAGGATEPGVALLGAEPELAGFRGTVFPDTAPAGGTSAAESGRLRFGTDHDLPPHGPLELVRLDRSWPAVGRGGENTGYNPAAAQLAAAAVEPGSTRIAGPEPGRGNKIPALQVHNRYLIAETDEGVVVIDQHALHERILYEQLREKVLAGVLESQALLVPEPVDLSPAEAAAVLESRDVLAQLGVAITPFGGGTVLVSSYPAMLANVPPAEVLRDLVDKLLAGGKSPDRRDLLDELLHMISCKAAIKAGDRLSGDEIAALLDQRHLAQDAHHCPHGRPTALMFTREELDRQFKRT